jgi:hypothetical protein
VLLGVLTVVVGGEVEMVEIGVEVVLVGGAVVPPALRMLTIPL